MRKTVNDMVECHTLLDLAADADASEGIRQGLEDAKTGMTRDAREVLQNYALFMAYRTLNKVRALRRSFVTLR
jgi:hypothetical protein